MENFAVSLKNGQNMMKMAKKLEPIYRTLVSPGFEESLKIIGDQLPVLVSKYPSGQRVFDWTIPLSWQVHGGYIMDKSGKKIYDQKNFPFLIGPYSQPFSGWISRDELRAHLHTLPHLPQAFSLCPSYYTNDWKLGVPHVFKENMTDEEYYVHIDAEFQPGHLCIGEYFLPGKSEKEILISSYLCHPHEANDNISGIVLVTELFKLLSAVQDRHYSYRLIIIPETIGSVTYLYHNQENIKNVIAAFNVTCCGDPGPVTVKKTWYGNALVDKAVLRVVRERNKGDTVKDFYLSGSDERQFNAPGFRVPMVTLMRTPPSDFPEYHSSFDDLSAIGEEYLVDSLAFIRDVLFIIDNNQIYKNVYATEPFLTQYGIFKQVHTGKFGVFHKTTSGLDSGYLNQIVIHETDGEQDMLTICEKHDCGFDEFYQRCQVFEDAGLIVELKRECMLRQYPAKNCKDYDAAS